MFTMSQVSNEAASMRKNVLLLLYDFHQFIFSYYCSNMYILKECIHSNFKYSLTGRSLRFQYVIFVGYKVLLTYNSLHRDVSLFCGLDICLPFSAWLGCSMAALG